MTNQMMADHWWWRPGWRPGRTFLTWHLTFEEQEDVHRLAAAHRAALAEVPGLTLVPDRWLHLTMQGLGFTDEVGATVVDRIVAGATDRLREVPPVGLTLSRAAVHPEAVLLTGAPAGPVAAVRTAIRAAIDTVMPVPEPADGFRPHVSVAYSAAAGPAGPVRAAVDLVTAPPATARITHADLIVLHRDRRMYEWETYARVSLEGPSDRQPHGPSGEAS
ncbi:2'-5' RNA ligase family protein [Streptomyces sp. NEAU-PBA10]|uniref:2'-5' RNA ligase family protein n=1 Tax=unclassified Streptomyces TaxID=2593676 RepID=UPI001EE4A152|nr:MULTISPECIES: 2'-5' RNA ligase family protein [unclassified Streptomyces]MCG5121619.1 2'-5' RNA ligase family protein [Streptomyces sp. T7(2022)]